MTKDAGQVPAPGSLTASTAPGAPLRAFDAPVGVLSSGTGAGTAGGGGYTATYPATYPAAGGGALVLTASTAPQEGLVARYPLGQPVRVSMTVRDVTGALVDAGTLTLLVKLAAADGTTTTAGTYSPAHDSLGTYHQDIPAADLATAGHYQYTGTATGAGAGVVPGDFDVFDPFETAVLPLADAKDQLNIPQSVTTSDAEIASFIATIETSLEGFTGGPLVNRVITGERAELMDSQTVILVRQRPLVSVTQVLGAGGTAIDISAGLDLDPNAGTIRRKLGLPFYGPFFSWLPTVYVTYVAGWGVSCPAAFNSFARIVVQNLWDTQHGPSARPSMGGQEMVTPPGFAFAIPNRAAELLDGSLNGMSFRSEAYV